MAVNLASPGVKVREVDLTTGRIDGISAQVGAFVGPFQKGPIGEPTLIETEEDLISVFGKPVENNSQNEFWLSASNYLSYGGVLRIVRADGDSLLNANSAELSTLKIDNSEDFDTNHATDTSWEFAAKTPGTWANGIKVCVIDDFADQIITGIATTSFSSTNTENIATLTGDIGITTTIITGISTALLSINDDIANENIPDGTAIIIAIGSSSVTVSEQKATTNTSPLVGESFVVTRDTVTTTNTNIQVGQSIIQSVDGQEPSNNGTVIIFNGNLRGVITGVGQEEIYVKITDRYVDDAAPTSVTYKENSATKSFNSATNGISIVDNTGATTATFSGSPNRISKDWYNEQTLGITNSTIYWKSIAPKPVTSEFSLERNSKNDAMHVVLIDDSGKITGTASNLLEKFTFLSKAIDSKKSPYQKVYVKDYIKTNSAYVYNGTLSSSVSSDLIPNALNNTAFTLTNGPIGNETQSTTFNVLGNKTYTLSSGFDYSANGGMDATLGSIVGGYEKFRNPAEFDINFLICGPSGGDTVFTSQAKANLLISIAEERKDCIACISPHKPSVVNVTSTAEQTKNIIDFFDPITSSSYAVLDSGIKYTLDRFNNKFVYLECNSDIAGLMARTAIDQYSWFSPAGPNRGSINNAVKLAYNPSQGQRDQLYTKRINPVISAPGQGIILFGDKTALSYGSAFDRINVRRLFLTIEKAIAKASRSQLFEFNDEITRTNFINIVEPYLRDIKAKRGITEFLVVCDRSNNTPEVIDSNEMVADIFVKPNRSINFIGLTFVATRTGVSFTEVVGNV